MLKKLDLCAYFFHKCVHIEETFLIKDDELLEKYNEIWEKVRNITKNEFDSEPVYNKKYLRTKIKSYSEQISTNFHNNKIPNEGSHCICLSVILIDSGYKKGKSYFPQVVFSYISLQKYNKNCF